MFISFNVRKCGCALRLVWYRSANGVGELRRRWIIDDQVESLDSIGHTKSCNHPVTKVNHTGTFDVCV
jgi:hypothetical protein